MSRKISFILVMAIAAATSAPAVEEYMPMHPGAIAETGYGVVVAPLRRTTSIDPVREPRPQLQRNMVTLKLPSRGPKTESKLRIVEAVPGEDGLIDFSSARTIPQPEMVEIPGMIDPEILALEQYNIARPEPLRLPQPIATPSTPPFPDLATAKPVPVVLPELGESPPPARPIGNAAAVGESAPPPAIKTDEPAVETAQAPAKPAAFSLRPPATGAASSLKPPESANTRPLAPPADWVARQSSPSPGPVPMAPLRDGSTVGPSLMGMGMMPPSLFDAFNEEENMYFAPFQAPPHAGARVPPPRKNEPPRIVMPEPDAYGMTPMHKVKNVFGALLRK